MRSVRTIALLFFLLLTGYTGFAQEFWMEPDIYFCKPGDSVTIEFKAGRNFTGRSWELSRRKLERVTFFYSNKTEDFGQKAKEGKSSHIKLPAVGEGTKLLVMQAVPATMEMAAADFNNYLKEYSLDAAYNQRMKTNSLDKPGKEIYVRYTKLLWQCGSKTDETYKKVAGLPLEIIPLKNPYALKTGDMITFKILFEGKPLFGARAFVWHRHNDRAIVQPIYTKKDGIIEARISNEGQWMISVVTMEPSTQPSGDWLSHWSTLVFGIKPEE